MQDEAVVLKREGVYRKKSNKWNKRGYKCEQKQGNGETKGINQVLYSELEFHHQGDKRSTSTVR